MIRKLLLATVAAITIAAFLGPEANAGSANLLQTNGLVYIRLSDRLPVALRSADGGTVYRLMRLQEVVDSLVVCTPTSTICGAFPKSAIVAVFDYNSQTGTVALEQTIVMAIGDDHIMNGCILPPEVVSRVDCAGVPIHIEYMAGSLMQIGEYAFSMRPADLLPPR